MQKVTIALLLALCLAQPAWAGLKVAKATYKKDDYAVAFRGYKPLAEQGYTSALQNLCNMYVNGQVVPNDYKRAMHWFRKATEQGIAGFENNMGDKYFFVFILRPRL